MTKRVDIKYRTSKIYSKCQNIKVEKFNYSRLE